MKKNIIYILLLIPFLSFGQQQPMVKAKVDTTNIRIGEQFQYQITVNQTEKVIIPKLEDLKGLEIVSEAKIDTIKNQLVKKYLLTGFDSGAYYIPKQQIFIKNQPYTTDSLLINVATVAIDTTKVKKFPIKGIKSEPYQLGDFKIYLWLLVPLVLLIALILYFVFKKKTLLPSETVNALPPFEEAIQKLHQLDGKLLWQNNKVKQYYSELTEIVRLYIERETNIAVLEKTTNQVVSSLTKLCASESIDTPKETIKKLEKLLSEADLVKFAKSKPLANEIEGDRQTAEDIIKTLKTTLATTGFSNNESVKPITLVQKPTIKKPSFTEKLLLIIILLALLGILSFGLAKSISMFNPSKTSISNVR